MISETDARAKILEAVRPLPPRKMSIWSASRTDSSRGEIDIAPEHVSEAIQYRTFDRTLWI